MENFLKKYIYEELNKSGVIKHGEFVLKSGEKSNFYVNIKELCSYPVLCSYLKYLFKIIFSKENNQADRICGVPYGGMYFSSIFSVDNKLPMIFLRKEAKTHGTKNLIEGIYEKGDKIILIEDVVTSGASVLEAIEELEKSGLIIEKVYTIFSRKKEGLDRIIEKGYKIDYVLSLDEYNFYNEKGNNLIENIRNLKTNNYNDDDIWGKNNWSQKLNKIIEKKKTPICLSLDVPCISNFFYILEACKEYICMVKIHLDMMKDFNFGNKEYLLKICKENNIMIWEDRKFCDIGKTHESQLKNIDWVDFVSVNPTGGADSLVPFFDKVGIFLLAEMSSKGNIINNEYTLNVLNMAYNNKKYISGIIGQNIPKIFKYDILSITPGINLNNKGDNLGQKYRKPSELREMTDILVVGRQIYNSEDPKSECVKILNDFYQ